MDMVFRTAGIYLGLLLLFRLMGRRSLSNLSSFDLILFLVLSEAIQNALVDDDKSVVMGMTVIATFLMLELGMSLLKLKWKFVDKIAEGSPVLLVDRAKVVEETLRKSRLTREDILQSARENQGLKRMDQIKYAVLETSGNLSIIPWEHDTEKRLERIESALERLLADRSGNQGTSNNSG